MNDTKTPILHRPITKAEGIERLRTLYSVLTGIPDRKIYLNVFADVHGELSYSPEQHNKPAIRKAVVHACGTTACAGGWAAEYPPFVALGLDIYGEGAPQLRYRGTGLLRNEIITVTDFEALAIFFGMRKTTAELVFAGKLADSRYTKGIKVREATNKQIALHRIRMYLFLNNAISEERNNELAWFEKADEWPDMAYAHG